MSMSTELHEPLQSLHDKCAIIHHRYCCIELRPAKLVFRSVLYIINFCVYYLLLRLLL